MDRRDFFLCLAVIETALLIATSLLPSQAVIDPGAGPVRKGDVEHLMAYSVYGFLLVSGLSGRISNHLRKAILIGIAVSFLTEFVQSFVPYRTADIIDAGIDITGVLVGAFVFYVLLKRAVIK